MEALAKCSPNGRDYIGDSAALNRAIDEHVDHRERMCAVQEELDQLAMGINELGE